MNEIEKNDHMVSVNFGPLDQRKIYACIWLIIIMTVYIRQGKK
jgi:hypothetical protein